jgi:hypothetical protein
LVSSTVPNGKDAVSGRALETVLLSTEVDKGDAAEGSDAKPMRPNPPRVRMRNATIEVRRKDLMSLMA